MKNAKIAPKYTRPTKPSPAALATVPIAWVTRHFTVRINYVAIENTITSFTALGGTPETENLSRAYRAY